MKDTNQYYQQLQSPRWKSIREEILKRDTNACRHCGSADRVQVHHRQYHIRQKTGVFVAPWDYSHKYLITLCEQCHKAGHEIYKVPVFHI